MFLSPYDIFNAFEDICCVNNGCICLIKNTVKTNISKILSHLKMIFFFNIFLYLVYFHQPLLQSSMSHNPSEINFLNLTI